MDENYTLIVRIQVKESVVFIRLGLAVGARLPLFWWALMALAITCHASTTVVPSPPPPQFARRYTV